MNPVEEAGFETWQVRSKATEASEQDIGNVAEWLKKAQQIWGQISQAKIQDAISAEMLKIIIQNIENIKILSTVCKAITDYDISIENIFAIFIPLLKQHISNEQILDKYKDILNIDYKTVAAYSEFVKNKILQKEKINNIPHDEFTEFVKEIILYFNIGNIGSLSKETETENLVQFNERLTNSLKSVFYN